MWSWRTTVIVRRATRARACVSVDRSTPIIVFRIALRGAAPRSSSELGNNPITRHMTRSDHWRYGCCSTSHRLWRYGHRRRSRGRGNDRLSRQKLGQEWLIYFRYRFYCEIVRKTHRFLLDQFHMRIFQNSFSFSKLKEMLLNRSLDCFCVIVFFFTILVNKDKYIG